MLSPKKCNKVLNLNITIIKEDAEFSSYRKKNNWESIKLVNIYYSLSKSFKNVCIKNETGEME